MPKNLKVIRMSRKGVMAEILELLWLHASNNFKIIFSTSLLAIGIVKGIISQN